MKKLLIILAVLFTAYLFSYDTFYELISDYSEGKEIENFIGYVEIEESRLEELVLEEFPNSKTPVMVEEEYTEIVYDEDGNESTITKIRMIPDVLNGETIMCQKTWIEYAKLYYASDLGVLLTVGWRDDNGNLTHKITSEEFYLWADYWGIENFVINGDKGIKTIPQMPIMGEKRMPIGIAPTVDTSNLVAFTVNNAYLTSFYVEEGIEENETIKALASLSMATGGGCFTTNKKAHTTYLINIDNITPEVFQVLVMLNGSIWVDWMDTHNLCTEVDAPNDKIIKYNADGTKGLISLKGKTWDEIRFTETPLFWDKYTLAY